MNSPCQEWAGYRTRHGYGIVRVGKYEAPKKAHRLAYEAAFGPIPKGAVVCHTCDNPPCVNPEHLFLGTHADNVRDRDAKGRQARGERHGNAKLTEATVRALRAAHTSGRSYRALARDFDIPRGTVFNAVSGRLWGWLR